MNKKAIGVAALGLCIAGLAAPTATADPVGTPAFRPLAGMGSDTTENVMQALSDVVVVGGQKVIGSYNTQPAGQIVNTKDEAQFAGRCNTAGGSGGVARANGSSAGRDALLAAMTPGSTTEGCLDFARSSSGGVAAGQTFVVMAQDGQTYAYPTNGDIGPAAAIGDLQLIYKCDASVAGAFEPLIPQAGSGTRASWATLMGISNTTLPSCVKDTIGGLPLQEHDGSKFTKSNQLVPFSVAQWVAQSMGTVPDSRGGDQIGNINGISSLQLNPGQFSVRNVGNIIPTTKFADSTSLEHKVFVNNGTGKSQVCVNGKSVIEQFGFLPVGC